MAGEQTHIQRVDSTTPAVVLRSAHHGGLGIVRSLGRLGVPVYAIDADRLTPAFRSRYCRGYFLCDVEHAPPKQALARMLQIGRKIGGRPVLIPTTDQSEIFVAEHAPLLQGAFRFADPGAALVRALYSKREMHCLAQVHGAATAESCFPQSGEEVSHYARAASFPVMVKAIDDNRLRQRGYKTKFLVRSSRELLELYDRLRDSDQPNLVFQEYIAGGADWMFNGYFDQRSECRLAFTGRKLRQFPVGTGVTSLGVCEHNEALAEAAKKFMQSVGYKGIVDLDYRYDARCGAYRLLDVNPRIGCTFRLFVSADGTDVARALYFDLTGQPLGDAAPQEGRKWVVEDFDLLASLGYWLNGTLTLKEWVASYRGVRETACFAWNDPLPLLPLWLEDVRQLIAHLRRRTPRLPR